MMIICSVNRERPELDRKRGTDEQTEIQCTDLQKLDTLDDHLPRREVQRQIWKTVAPVYLNLFGHIQQETVTATSNPSNGY